MPASRGTAVFVFWPLKAISLQIAVIEEWPQRQCESRKQENADTVIQPGRLFGAGNR
jgi:hypothetical protein